MSQLLSSSDLSESCLAAVFLGAGQSLEMRRFPIPEPGRDEALVQIESCTICGSDLHTITGARTETVPSILGHEIIGRVERLGDPPACDVDGFPLHPGDRITWSTSVSCDRCNRCEDGLPQKCRKLRKYGHELAEGPYALSGGLAEYLLLRRGSTTVRIGADIPAAVICPANCATATVAAAVRASGPMSGRSVLIFGAGMLGVTATAFVRSRGARMIAVCDRDARRLDRAREFGADCGIAWQPHIDEMTRQLLLNCRRESFDIVLEMSGSADAVEMAMRLGDVGAHIVLVGSVMKSRHVTFDPEQVVRRCLSIQGVHNYTPNDLRTAISFLEQFGSAHPFAELVEFTYPLQEANAAIEKAVRDRPFRVAIRP
jgi:alcohol dehydrogenase